MKTLKYNHGNHFPEARRIVISDTILEYMKQQCDYDEEALEEVIASPRQTGRSLYYAILLAMYEGGYCPTVCELQLIIERVSFGHDRKEKAEKEREQRLWSIYN